MWSNVTQGAGTPPIGTGTYPAWVVFVVVIMRSVALGVWVTSAVGLKGL